MDDADDKPEDDEVEQEEEEEEEEGVVERPNSAVEIPRMCVERERHTHRRRQR